MQRPRFVRWIKNPYVLFTIGFAVWMLFFDSEDLLTAYQLSQQIKQLQAEKAYYLAEIAVIKKEADALMLNEESLEKLCREKYFMKKPTEDVYIVEEQDLKK